MIKYVDNLENGEIVVTKTCTGRLVLYLIVSLNRDGKICENLTSGDTWIGKSSIKNVIIIDSIPSEYITVATNTLYSLFNNKRINNLDYIEALAKLREYELPKV
jgi:hypothetical protein